MTVPLDPLEADATRQAKPATEIPTAATEMIAITRRAMTRHHMAVVEDAKIGRRGGKRPGVDTCVRRGEMGDIPHTGTTDRPRVAEPEVRGDRGAGMAGVLSAIKLARLDSTMSSCYEKADRLGGTWRENTYPGIACDVPSHLYSYSFASNPEWSHRVLAGGRDPGVLRADGASLRRRCVLRFGTEITRCEFEDGRWRLEAADGHRDDVDVVIAATGVLHHPGMPRIAGLESFAGPVFHSARWNHDT